MYSRSTGKSEPFKIPEHYSGCAFSQATQEAHKPPPALGVAKPSAPPPREAESPPPPPSHHEKPQESPTPPSLPVLGGLGGAFRRGIGFEELLLLGLILLLSQTDADSHLSLMLGLLLFCG